MKIMPLSILLNISRNDVLPVPHIFAVSADELCYLQSDLGNTSLLMLYVVDVRLVDAIILLSKSYCVML